MKQVMAVLLYLKLIQLSRRHCRCPSGCCTLTGACTPAATRRPSTTTTSSRMSHRLAGGDSLRRSCRTSSFHLEGFLPISGDIATFACADSSGPACSFQQCLLCSLSVAESLIGACIGHASRHIPQCSALDLSDRIHRIDAMSHMPGSASRHLLASHSLHDVLAFACRSPTEPRVHLLYRPGHYDILYTHPAPGAAGDFGNKGIPP